MSKSKPLTTKRKKRWLYTLYLLLVCLGGAELALRLFDPLGITYFFEVHRYFKTMQEDERFAYIHPANHHDSFQGVDMKINQYGLRGPEFAAEKTDTRKRVMILGDSVVLGWGVDYASIFPARLQQMLDDAGTDVEIVPAGVGSWNTRTEYEFLRAKGLGYNPDTLVLVVVGNDFEIKRQGRTEIARETLTEPKQKKNWLQNAAEDTWRVLIRNSFLFAYVQYGWKQVFDNGTYNEINSQSPAWQDARLALQGIIDLCQKHGIELVVYIYRSAAKDPSDSPLQLFEEYLQQQNIPAFALPEQLFSNGTVYRNSVVDSHANADGHELIAKKMWRDLQPWFTD